MISILSPTRKRPAGLTTMYDSARRTANSPEDIECIAVTDPDDMTYLGIDIPGLRFVTAPEGTIFSELWNVAWREARGDIFQMGSDDEVFRTPGWDRIVREAFDAYPDRILMAYGYCGEGVRQDDFGELPFISREWTDVVGRFCPGYYTHDYVDAHLNDVAQRIWRHQRVDILTEHIRIRDGNAPHDETSLGIEARMKAGNMAPVFAAHDDERAEEAEKLLAALIP